MLNGQQIYNKVKKHLLKQGEQSLTRGECMYRGPRGLKCAAGVLISDENYSRILENCMVDSTITPGDIGAARVVQALVDSGVDPAWIPLVKQLQSVHDAGNPRHWREKLAVVARDFRLRP